MTDADKRLSTLRAAAALRGIVVEYQGIASSSESREAKAKLDGGESDRFLTGGSEQSASFPGDALVTGPFVVRIQTWEREAADVDDLARVLERMGVIP